MKRTIDRHVDEVIDKVATGENTVPSEIHTADVDKLVRDSATALLRPIDTINNQSAYKSDSLSKEVDDIINKIQDLDSIKELEPEIESEGGDLSWEDDISFAIELMKEHDRNYEPNYYFRKQTEISNFEERFEFYCLF